MDFKKISKARARRLFLSFKPFIMTASKISPQSELTVTIDEHVSRDYTTEDGFEQLVNEFRYYNCNSETGRGVAFYVKV